jgi:hypothetical protein
MNEAKTETEMKAVHYIIITCGALVSASPAIEAAFPQIEPYLKAMTTVLGVIGTVLGTISPSATAGATVVPFPVAAKPEAVVAPPAVAA